MYKHVNKKRFLLRRCMIVESMIGKRFFNNNQHVLPYVHQTMHMFCFKTLLDVFNSVHPKAFHIQFFQSVPYTYTFAIPKTFYPFESIMPIQNTVIDYYCCYVVSVLDHFTTNIPISVGLTSLVRTSTSAPIGSNHRQILYSL